MPTDQERNLERFIDQIGLRYIKGRELTWLWHRTRKGVSNSCPPERLWEKCIQPLIVLDEIRHHLGEPVRITSAYRSPPYNRAVGGESMSYHMEFMALDFTCAAGAAVSAAVARELRGTRFKWPGGGSFVWHGGIGRYPAFVHIDTRGRDANW